MDLAGRIRNRRRAGCALRQARSAVGGSAAPSPHSDFVGLPAPARADHQQSGTRDEETRSEREPSAAGPGGRRRGADSEDFAVRRRRAGGTSDSVCRRWRGCRCGVAAEDPDEPRCERCARPPILATLPRSPEVDLVVAAGVKREAQRESAAPVCEAIQALDHAGLVITTAGRQGTRPRRHGSDSPLSPRAPFASPCRGSRQRRRRPPSSNQRSPTPRGLRDC